MTPTPRSVDEIDGVADVRTLAGCLFCDAPLPSLILTSDGTIVHVNTRATATFGWSREELVGQSVEVLMPTLSLAQPASDRPTRPDAPLAHPRRMAAVSELPAVRRDGTELVIELLTSELATRGGRYFVAVARDVTERHRESAQLAHTNAELRDKTAAYAKLDHEKNALLGMVAHDLRTPISVIIGHAELVASVAPTEPLEKHRALVDAIERAAKMMRRIVDDLLDWSAIEAGALRLARRLVDPVTVAADALALAGLAAAQRGIDLSLDGEPGLPPIEVDPGRMSQVLGNLLGNALKYSPSGHPVRVHIGRSGDDSIEYTVADRGEGIAPEVLEHIFRPFETGGRPPVDGERATGLGLAIVKRIVDAHGGTIGVESEPGAGSTFRVTLPIRAPAPRGDDKLTLVGK